MTIELKIDSIFTAINSIFVLLITIGALVYTVKTYLLKSGLHVRGSFGYGMHYLSDVPYITNITIENLKDKAMVIFGIYLKMGNNYYLLIEDYKESPLILKPFGIIQREFEPLNYYSINMVNKFVMHLSMFGTKPKQQLVLNTTDGKHIVNDDINHWAPEIEAFKNQYTEIIYPVRFRYKDKSYGGDVKYLVDVKLEDEKEIVIPIGVMDNGQIHYSPLSHLNLTQELIKSKERLNDFLEMKKKSGQFNCMSFKLIDFKEHRKRSRFIHPVNTIQANFMGNFQYHVMGRVRTIFHNLKKKIEFKKNGEKL